MRLVHQADPSRLFDEIEPHHHHVPDIILQCPLEHGVSGVGIEHLGDPQKPDLALVTQRLERRDDL